MAVAVAIAKSCGFQIFHLQVEPTLFLLHTKSFRKFHTLDTATDTKRSPTTTSKQNNKNNNNNNNKNNCNRSRKAASLPAKLIVNICSVGKQICVFCLVFYFFFTELFIYLAGAVIRGGWLGVAFGYVG